MIQKIKSFFKEKPAKAIGLTVLIVLTIVFIVKKLRK